MREFMHWPQWLAVGCKDIGGDGPEEALKSVNYLPAL